MLIQYFNISYGDFHKPSMFVELEGLRVIYNIQSVPKTSQFEFLNLQIYLIDTTKQNIEKIS